MQKRGWDVKDTAVMAITDELDTARRRTTGSMDALKAAGFPEQQSIACRPNPTISRRV
jgi:L-arabinose transport system substrate-binding protein